MATLFRPHRRPSFYHRAIIPRRLRSYFKGRAQLWRSLSTNDLDDATQKAWLDSSGGLVHFTVTATSCAWFVHDLITVLSKLDGERSSSTLARSLPDASHLDDEGVRSTVMA